jgi:hypothetical protein
VDEGVAVAGFAEVQPEVDCGDRGSERDEEGWVFHFGGRALDGSGV